MEARKPGWLSKKGIEAAASPAVRPNAALGKKVSLVSGFLERRKRQETELRGHKKSSLVTRFLERQRRQDAGLQELVSPRSGTPRRACHEVVPAAQVAEDEPQWFEGHEATDDIARAEADVKKSFWGTRKRIAESSITAQLKAQNTEMGSRVEAAIQDCLDANLEKSSENTYESAVGSALKDFGTSCSLVMPVKSVEQITAIMATTKGKSWGYTKVMWSALRSWQVSRGQLDIAVFKENKFFRAFWRGLKKHADHSSHATMPFRLEDVEDFIASRQKADGSWSTVAGHRDSAWALLAFYGVRRVSETINIMTSHVNVKGTGIEVFIPKMKNDQVGKGMSCFIEEQPRARFCPVKVISSWMETGTKRYKNEKGLPLFFVTKGARAGQQMSDQTLRSGLAKWIFKAKGAKSIYSTHSLRKGGASFYIERGVDPRHVMKQGGWQSLQCMERIYVHLEDKNRKRAMRNLAA